ncbi:hypothetical protein BCR44DRAFT_1066631 [Catenaria anguillulae PL171]|uniref:Uncharacterized protein n=1 Tax=Catenaria anguillulae PL171 TaxID=765915 RepID=A0A1Y2HRS1_9FUNG|nr:hypothetical protein BCR44DRAFT_1066631 [Catenaria anguillulae PL171]
MDHITERNGRPSTASQPSSTRVSKKVSPVLAVSSPTARGGSRLKPLGYSSSNRHDLRISVVREQQRKQHQVSLLPSTQVTKSKTPDSTSSSAFPTELLLRKSGLIAASDSGVLVGDSTIVTDDLHYSKTIVEPAPSPPPSTSSRTSLPPETTLERPLLFLQHLQVVWGVEPADVSHSQDISIETELNTRYNHFHGTRLTPEDVFREVDKKKSGKVCFPEGHLEQVHVYTLAHQQASHQCQGEAASISNTSDSESGSSQWSYTTQDLLCTGGLLASNPIPHPGVKDPPVATTVMPSRASLFLKTFLLAGRMQTFTRSRP